MNQRARHTNPDAQGGASEKGRIAHSTSGIPTPAGQAENGCQPDVEHLSTRSLAHVLAKAAAYLSTKTAHDSLIAAAHRAKTGG
jgi:hypothetical protein